MADNYYLILLHGLMWFYVIYRLWRGREIEYEVESSSLVSFPAFLLMGGLLIYNHRDIAGILSLLSCTLAGGLYKSIPSGFSEKAVYLRGRRLFYRDIREWLAEEEGGKLRLSFHAKYRMAVLITACRHRDMILAYKSIWQQLGHK